jgi:hypothetical protein
MDKKERKIAYCETIRLNKSRWSLTDSVIEVYIC